MLDVSVVVGNPNPQSRTLQVAEQFTRCLLGDTEHTMRTIDLADYAGQVFQWSNETLDALTEKVAASQLVVFASPTYKATYTALLKAFLDRYQTNGLEGVVAIPLHTGAGPHHAMGPTVSLAPLLMELGAIVPGRGVYFITDDMSTMQETVARLAAPYRKNLARLGAVAKGMGLVA